MCIYTQYNKYVIVISLLLNILKVPKHPIVAQSSTNPLYMKLRTKIEERFSYDKSELEADPTGNLFLPTEILAGLLWTSQNSWGALSLSLSNSTKASVTYQELLSTKILRSV